MSTVPCPHRVAARTPGDNATVSPHGDAPVSGVQEGDDFWTLKSFAYNLEGNGGCDRRVTFMSSLPCADFMLQLAFTRSRVGEK